jgi:hypothetical protein
MSARICWDELDILTLIDLHVRNSLPLVHGNKPSIVLLPAAEVNDKLFLVAIQSSKHCVEALLRELS